MKVAFLFPGQGAQQPGMLNGLTNHAAVMETFRQARQIIGQDPQIWDRDLASLRTNLIQMYIFIAGVAVSRLLEDRGAVPDAVAGLSLGCFTAAVVSGALEFEQALRIVRLRGELMQEAYPAGYGISAIVGLTEHQLSLIVEQSSTPEAPVYVTNVNAPQQVLIAGSDVGMELVSRRALAVGAQKAERLQINVPSHCALLRTISERLASTLAKVQFSAPKIPYISNRRGRLLRDASSIRDDLWTSLQYPVRWHDATTVLFELGVRLFVELPPGQTLTDLATASFPDARAIAVENNRLDSVIKLIKREKSADRIS
ncbi:MAG: malonate decarboxylase subunit epsilon [Candidatus Acidiferrales bacterium]